MIGCGNCIGFCIGDVMKIIFLDIDGVLNYYDCWLRSENQNTQDVWDEDCVNELNRIINETGAKVVISSTWRLYPELDQLIENDIGIKEGAIIGKTKDYLPIIRSEGTCRGDEIQDWLDNTDEVIESFVILDDDDDMRDLLPYLIQTSFYGRGLTKELADKAIEFLNG